MMKKSLFLLACLITTLTMAGTRLSPEQACRAAQRFIDKNVTLRNHATRVTARQVKAYRAQSDGKVDVEDMNIIINIMLETDQAENYDGRANLNGDDKVDIEDMNAVINIMLATRSGIRAD